MSLELSRAREFVTWMARKIELNHLSSSAKTRQVRRGEVYWCEFGLNVGSEMSKETPRPAVVVQNNRGNKCSSNTIVVPITHDEGEGPYLVPITTQRKHNGDVLLDGKANTSNVICVSKARLRDYITILPQADLKKVDKSLADMAGLKHYYDKLETKYNNCHADLITLMNKMRSVSEMINNSDIDEKLKKRLQEELDRS